MKRFAGGDAVRCCSAPGASGNMCGGPGNLCIHFVDSAPSGRYGTLTYIARAILTNLAEGRPDAETLECCCIQ